MNPREEAGAGEAGPGRRVWLALGGLLLVAHLGLVAAVFVTAPHTGGDNAAYVALARSLLEGHYVELWDPSRAPHTKYPPVFPLTLAVAVLLGARTWVTLKLVPALFTVLGVAVTYAWAGARRGPWFGAGVAALFALASANLDASHWVLSEPAFVAFAMLSLWAWDRWGDAERGGVAPWGVLGGAGAIFAYFTRSAGLPLVLAVLAWLALRRSWRALGMFAVALSVPAALWTLRDLSGDQTSYLGEFWMVNPYDPALGTLTVSTFVGRLVENGVGYATEHVPGGILGFSGTWVAVLGVALLALAVGGWVRAVRRPGVAELFVPLYVGLILVWPQVWSGDRFALPLYPLLIFYAGDLLRTISRTWRPLSRTALLGGAALVLGATPAYRAWGMQQAAATCRQVVRASGPYACWGGGVQEFVGLARWSGAALPDGAAVLSRKPRIFYAMSGVPSRVFPFSTEADALLSEADALAAAYVVLDRWDGQAVRYVGGALRESPGAFCLGGGFASEGTSGTRILGILPPGERTGGEAGATIRIANCPEAMFPGRSEASAYDSGSIPILERDDVP